MHDLAGAVLALTRRPRGFGGNDFWALVDVPCELSDTPKARPAK
ncbi:hypothetical protein [Herbaspirillum lusitanum]|nr:hypothetical protein [Herbaspirillum lusitanum]